MIPFCRTLEEADQVLEVLAENGLKRGENGLQVYLMCEIPSNVELAAEFSQRFDGFSIGSNDLTQLVLGVDRDSEALSHLFDERDPAVKQTINRLIPTAHTAESKVGICGQAPSDYPDFAAFLVEAGIDSISLNPDSVVAVKRRIAEMEG
jgi:pyruvate,water dikinase